MYLLDHFIVIDGYTHMHDVLEKLNNVEHLPVR